MNDDFERVSVDTRYGRMSMLVRNGRFPVLFLHGLGATANAWKKLSSYLSGYKIIYLDLLGHGSSAKPDIQYNIPAQCNAISDVMQGLSIDRFALVGNSYGGWISLYFSIFYRAPEYLVLIDSAGLNPGVGTLPEDEIDRFVKTIVKSGKMNTKEIIKNIILNNAASDFRMNEQILKRLSTKVLIIWGENDQVIDLKYAYSLNKFIKDSDLHILEEAGHSPHISAPEKVAELINEFIRV
ncbi:MAG: alpha/beta fold hydrolase [Thermoplasmata archaeon]